jgi:hypothetical protein
MHTDQSVRVAKTHIKQHDRMQHVWVAIKLEWGLLTKLSQPLLGVCFAHLSQSLVDCVAILAQAGRQITAIINERLAIGMHQPQMWGGRQLQEM